MKKLIALCAVTILVTSVTGCGCCRRLRDFICRGARCGPAPAIAAPPVVAGPPVAAAPMAFDPGCSYAGYDPGCGYPGGTVVGYPPAYDSGWIPGGPAGCDSCNGGYSLPSYDGGYSSGGGYLVEPGASGQIDPGPATGSGTR